MCRMMRADRNLLQLVRDHVSQEIALCLCNFQRMGAFRFGAEAISVYQNHQVVFHVTGPIATHSKKVILDVIHRLQCGPLTAQVEDIVLKPQEILFADRVSRLAGLKLSQSCRKCSIEKKSTTMLLRKCAFLRKARKPSPEAA